MSEISVSEIVNRCIGYIQRTIKNEIPHLSCKEKELKQQWKREKVVQEVVEKLSSSIGPSQLK